jgi:hypothetical protein
MTNDQSVISRRGPARLEPFSPRAELGLPTLSVVPPVPCRPESHETRLPSGERNRYPPLVVEPESESVAVINPVDAECREQQLSEVLPSPPIPSDSMDAEAMQIDQDDPGGTSLTLEPVEIQEEVAEVQILMERVSPVQGRGDASDLRDHPALEDREFSRIQPFGQLW